MLGAKTTATLSFDDIDPKQYEGLVIIGGAGSQAHLWGHELLIPIVNIFHQHGKVVAAICLAPVVLAQAGILKGKKATYFENPASFREMRIGSAVVTNAPVVRDGRIITANGPAASKAFADEIVHALTAVEW
jgi:protease I